MMRLLLLALLLLPLIEVYLFIRVGSLIGALPTIVLCIVMAFLGNWLFRLQGMQTIHRVRDKLRRGETPAVDLIETLILAVAGLLLLLPGFFSDMVGLVCLIPVLRARIARIIIARLAGLRAASPDQAVIIEGEYWEDQDKRLR